MVGGRSASGKVDRKQLLKLAASRDRDEAPTSTTTTTLTKTSREDQGTVAPRTEMERLLVSIVAETLRLDPSSVGVLGRVQRQAPRLRILRFWCSESG